MAVGDVQSIPQGALLGSAVILFLLALHIRDLIRAVTALAAGSVFVAASFFVLSAPFAGVLELTVGAGLIAVLFLVAITLTGRKDDVEMTG